MRQLCPYCAHTIDVPESAAGTDYSCPMCLERFAVPKSYSPQVLPDAPPPGYVPLPPIEPIGLTPPADRPAPPPGLVLLPTSGEKAERKRRAATPPPSGPTTEWALEVRSQGMAWFPVVALSMAMILTFFGWYGCFPGGYRVYTQTPWQNMTGAFTNQTLLEESMAEAKELRAVSPSNWMLMLPFLMALSGALGLALLERFGGPLEAGRVPPVLGWLVPLTRAPITTGLILATVALGCILTQRVVGFGLESAVQARIVAEKERTANVLGKDGKPSLLTPFQEGSIVGKYAASTTTAYDLALLTLLIAVLTLIFRWSEERRGESSQPALIFRW